MFYHQQFFFKGKNSLYAQAERNTNSAMNEVKNIQSTIAIIETQQKYQLTIVYQTFFMM